MLGESQIFKYGLSEDFLSKEQKGFKVCSFVFLSLSS